MVSLPSRWVRDFELGKGDEVEVEELGKQIVVRNEKEIKLDKIQIDISNLDERVVVWLLSSLHKAGYDEISVLYDDPKVIKVVQELIRDLFIGFAIVEQTNKRCVIKCVSKNLESEFDATLKRAFFVTQNLGESVYEAAKSGNFESASDLIALEHTNNQLTNFCERILNKRGYKDYKKSNFIYAIVWNLEKIADDHKHICEYLSELKKGRINKQILDLIKKTNDYFKQYFELFYKFDMEKLSNANKVKKAVQKEIMNIEASKKEFALLHHLNSIIAKITDFSGNIIAMHQDGLDA